MEGPGGEYRSLHLKGEERKERRKYDEEKESIKSRSE
jgi:hypothetical protein